MSLVRLNIKSRIELETRVLAAALKQSFERGDAQGVSLAHRQLFLLLKDAGRPEESGVATVHFSDGVPPGLPVVPGLESDTETAEDFEPFGAPPAEPPGQTDESKERDEGQGDSSAETGESWELASPRSGGFEQLESSLPQEPPGVWMRRSNAPDADDAPAPKQEPGSLAERLYSEPLFAEHKPSTEPLLEHKGQKTTLDRLPASTVSIDNDIDQSSIGELDEGRGSEFVEPESAQPSQDEAAVHSFAPAEEYFFHRAPPVALSAEAALAQLAMSGYGHVEPTSFSVDQVMTETADNTALVEESAEDQAFGDPGGITDAPFVVAEDADDDGKETQAVGDTADGQEGGSLAPPQTVASRSTAPAPELLSADLHEAHLKARLERAQIPTASHEPGDPNKLDVYMLLDVSQMSSFEEIHKNFLRKVRRILREIRKNRAVRYEKLAELQKLWIARDILTDPVTRTDYDFRDMGLRGTPDAVVSHAPEDQQQARINNRTPLRIGELLQCAGLLEPAELEIACDMHKAMPEMQFGTFLVRQGFIQERDLESVLLGQRLLRDGAITVAQFQVAMELSQSRGMSIGETLVEKGYLSESDLSGLLEPAAGDVAPPVVQIREIVVGPKSHTEAGSRPAVWTEQLDWGRPEGADSKDEPPVLGGLGGLLKAQTPVQVEDAVEPIERIMKVNAPETQIDLKKAVPSWQDQLDWAAPGSSEPPPAIPAGGGSMPFNQSGYIEPTPASANASGSDAPSRPALRVSNAVPTWKDQLDWSSPAESQTPPDTGVSTSENEPLAAAPEFEFASMDGADAHLREAARHSAQDESAVDLEAVPTMKVKGETTYEQLPVVEVEADSQVASDLVEVDVSAKDLSESDLRSGDTETGAADTAELDAIASGVDHSTTGAGGGAEEEQSPPSGRRDKKKRGKEKRKKRR